MTVPKYQTSLTMNESELRRFEKIKALMGKGHKALWLKGLEIYEKENKKTA